MKTEIAIEGTKFLINGKPTYEGVSHRGRSVEGMLFNSRMVQAIFDDECPETRPLWRYPDTNVWDPERNTSEFCAQLPAYRAHGLLAVTVGLQGGGSVYTPAVSTRYLNSAYRPDGSFKAEYFNRLSRVLEAADQAGVAVIVNYFYIRQAGRLEGEETVCRITERVSEWLLRTNYRNILVDVANESNPRWPHPIFHPDNVHRLIDIVRSTTADGRRLLVGVSASGGKSLPAPRWLDAEDLSLPHGNGNTPEQLREKLRTLKAFDGYHKRPRPIVVNEDSIFVENLEAAIEEGASWGFYCQGYGSDYQDRMNWKERGREARYEDLSGFQTLPVNWRINTEDKKAFFERLRAITRGEG
ncbi:MAG: hypothetical protein NTW86_19860 [Candidatus Sumerlaeota bacterium]|nr:hypothetical protein [Candidatus Sumerlaeota bacterium]